MSATFGDLQRSFEKLFDLRSVVRRLTPIHAGLILDETGATATSHIGSM